MSVGVFLITHEQVGSGMLAAARNILPRLALPVDVLEVPMDSEISMASARAVVKLRALDRGKGVLILTDLYGATPSNVAVGLTRFPGVRVVSGLNLPMLLRIFNYPGDDLDSLLAKAMDGGQRGIVNPQPNPSD